MDKSAVENLIEAIKGSQAEYPSVMMTKKHWLEVVNEIERLQAVEANQLLRLTPEQIEINRLNFMWSL